MRAHGSRQALPWIVHAGDRRIDRPPDAADVLFRDGHEQAALGGKMHIDGANGDADLARDVADGGGCVALIGELLGSSRQDAPAGLILDARTRERALPGPWRPNLMSERSFSSLPARHAVKSRPRRSRDGA